MMWGSLLGVRISRGGLESVCRGGRSLLGDRPFEERLKSDAKKNGDCFLACMFVVVVRSGDMSSENNCA